MGAYETLLAKARRIKTESSDRANTALRVGGWMEEALTWLEGMLAGKADAVSPDLITEAKTIVGAINEVASYAGMSEERYDALIARLTDAESAINVLEQSIEGCCRLREYPSASLFPQSGKSNTLYIDASAGAMYRWDGDQYTVMGGYTAGDGISINGSVISNTHTLITTEEIDSICI
ncbi:MAG: hypothetical protein VZQ98_12350 [Bacteroidales bacterium]|nr:hypothetical protein [Bacteroidales bacterium]